MARALVFDLGGTHLRSGLVGDDGEVRQLDKRRIPSVATGARQEDIWECVLTTMRDCERAHRDILPAAAPIVVAFPAPVVGNRTIVHAPILTGPGESVPDLAAVLEGATGRRVFLLNDVSAAAWHFAARTSVTRFMVVTVSSGIGSKLFDRRHPGQVLDEPLYAGEIGHYVVDDHADAPVCECGGRGHLGAIASGRGIERAARRQAVLDPIGFRASHLSRSASAERLSNEEHLVPAALAGDEWTLNLLRQCTRPLSRTLLATYMAVGLDRIFLIGGFAQALGDVYAQIVRSQMAEMSRYSAVETTLASVIESVAPGEEVCLDGCRHFLLNSPVVGSAMIQAFPPTVSAGLAIESARATT